MDVDLELNLHDIDLFVGTMHGLGEWSGLAGSYTDEAPASWIRLSIDLVW